MTDLAALWLRLPGADPALLDRIGVSFRAAQKIGGVRQGKTGLLLPCYIDPPSCWHVVEDVALIDFCIFDPDQPSQWRTAYGNGVMLGEEAFREARVYRVPLPVFKTPLGWLQSGGAGVFILDARAFAIDVMGCRDLQLVGEDLEHGEELLRLVERGMRQCLPQVRVAA